METKLQSKQQYPRFIQNKPCGIDKFDGGSQERLAKTIARHFCQNDSLDEECTLPRIIGIEGIWGSGQGRRIIFITIFLFAISFLYYWLLIYYRLFMSTIFLIFIRYFKT